MSDSRSIHAAAGEYLVLGELLKREKMAFLAQGPTQGGWDIVIVSDHKQCGQDKRIQVKTIDWPNRKAVQINMSNDFDSLVIVLLDKGKQKSRFLIFDKQDIERHLSKENPSRKGRERTMNIGVRKFDELKGQHEDNWDLLC